MMRIRNLFLPLLLMGTAGSFMQVARGAVIVANTGALSGAAGQTSTTGLLAAGFLSPLVATSITSVNAVFERGEGLPDLSMALYDSVSGNPGSLIAALGSQSIPGGGAQTLTFTPAASVALAAATQYFLVVSCSNCFPSGTVPGITNNWRTSNPVVVGGLAGADVSTGIFFSANNGASWGNFLSPQTPIFTVNGDVGSEIPEPSSAALLLSGLALAAWLRRGRG